MLGKTIIVKMDYTKKNYISKVGNSIYCGYTSPLDSTNQNHVRNIPVYYISKKQPEDLSYGIVIAILNTKINEQEKLVVAPHGYIYYEPEIRSILSKISHLSIHSICCRYEKSCGAIILINQKNEPLKVLTVKNKRSRTWGFPKGHIEKGETERQTALREVKEETGLSINILNGFREVSDYYSFGNVKKRAVFFIAYTTNTKVELQVEELKAYKWLTYSEAFKLFAFRNNISLLKKAFNFVNTSSLLEKIPVISQL